MMRTMSKISNTDNLYTWCSFLFLVFFYFLGFGQCCQTLKSLTQIENNGLKSNYRRCIMALRTYMASAKRSLKIGLLPADGIGREVLPVDTVTITAIYLLILLTLFLRPPAMPY